jgi:putative peptide zinc metalloprotease protein
MARSIFSESWYVISSLKVALLHSVSVQRQVYRGEEWYLLRDRLNNKFFRIKPEAYRFVMALHTQQSIEEIWEEYLEKNPQTTPTQDEVVTLLSQLHTNNLLYFKNQAKSEDIFERFVEYKAKNIQSKLFSFLFIRVPLFDPEKFLQKSKPVIDALFSPFALLIWLLIMLWGAKSVGDNLLTLSIQAEGMLSPSNLIYLYITMFVLKVFHELGHAMVCNKFGGPVHTLGLMFLVFTPLPYMDASSSWTFKNKWHRAMVGSAGMFIELFFAAVAAIIWANTGEGFINSLSFNIMIIGSVSSIVFNANPLLKFDAYYILSDVLEIPNLFQRSKEQVYYLVEKYLFGLEYLESPSRTQKEAIWMLFYAVMSFVYRLFVSIAIAIFVADQIFIVGLLVVILSLFMWILKPIYQFIIYLWSSPKLNKNRSIVMAKVAFVSTLLLFLIAIIPVSYSLKAQGVVYAKAFLPLYTPNEGYIKTLHVQSGEVVKKGALIASLSNHEINLDIQMTQAKLQETLALELKAQNSIADLQPIKERIKLLNEKLKLYKRRKEELNIYAPQNGVWILGTQKYKKGFLLQKREQLGYLIDAKQGFEFVAVALQEKAYELFNEKDLKASLKIYGEAHNTLLLTGLQILPYRQQKLPSPALGWMGGGEIQVASDDPTGTKSLEAFFEIRATIEGKGSLALLHERRGVVRIELPSIPLWQQSIKAFKQLLQKRYQL